jgi:hypothetical protein
VKPPFKALQGTLSTGGLYSTGLAFKVGVKVPFKVDSKVPLQYIPDSLEMQQ